MRRFRLLGLLFLAGLFCGCGREATAVSAEPEDEYLHFLYDIKQIEAREEASVYIADWYRPDEELLKERLLENDIWGEELNAVGKSIYAGPIEEPWKSWEVLIVYDGGAAFGEASGVLGGFHYALNYKGEKEMKNYQNVVITSAGHPENVEQLLKYNSRADFAAFGELAFLDVQTAVEQVESVLQECGAPQVQIDTVYTLDVDTLTEHEQRRQTCIEETKEPMAWEKEDEAYLMLFSQAVDGLPLINHLWDTNTRGPGEATETEITAILSESGILNISMTGAVTVQEECEKCELITPQQAEQLFLEEYGRAFLISDLYVEKLELEYVSLVSGDKLKLVPAWVFCVAREQEIDDMATVKAYEHFIVNAVTGERILSAVEKK